MQASTVKIETKQVSTKSTRTTDCFRRRDVKAEDGTVSKQVVRWQQDHQVMANLQVVDGGKGGIFHNGARIA